MAAGSDARRRCGLTLGECVVVLVVVLMAVLLLMPALLKARADARIRLCEARLTRMIAATLSYESSQSAFPSGTLDPEGPIRAEPKGHHHNWLGQLLPFLDEQALFEQLDPQQSIYAEHHRALQQVDRAEWKCPSAPPKQHITSFAACHSHEERPIDADNTGVFYRNSHTTVEQVADGLSHTLFLAEKVSENRDLGWFSGTRATLRNTGTPLGARFSYAAAPEPLLAVGGFGSWHVGFSHSAMGNGAVVFRDHNIDPTLYQQLGHRSDGSAALKSSPRTPHNR